MASLRALLSKVDARIRTSMPRLRALACCFAPIRAHETIAPMPATARREKQRAPGGFDT